VDEWHAAASRSAGHTSGTRVFSAGRVGFVLVQFQVEHHVREREFVIDAELAWGGAFTL